MTPQSIPRSTDYVNDVLQQLFHGHGVDTTVASRGITFPTHPGLWANGELFACSDGSVLSNEVLLDNHPWHEMQDFMEGQNWPVAAKPYDVRVFLVVKDVE